MRIRYSLIVLLALGLSASGAGADVFQFAPTPADLSDLDHYYYYTWRIANTGIDQPIASATLTMKNIANWDSNPNVLYVHLLNTASSGVRSYYDAESGGDAFVGQGIELVTYRNLSTTPTTLTYEFDYAELAKLNDYLASGGDFALGFDPDCHYWNDGISLTVAEVAGTPVPEPATVSLLLAGSALLAWRHRRQRRLAAA